MSDSLEARVEALRRGLEQSGSMEYKMKLAEQFHDFLAKGVTWPSYNGLIYTSPTIPITFTNDTVTSNG